MVSPWIDVSVSKLRTHRDCSLRLSFKYVLRLPAPPEDARRFFKGAVCHNLFHEWRFRRFSPGWMSSQVDIAIEAFREKNKVVLRKDGGLEKITEEVQAAVVKIEHAAIQYGFRQLGMTTEKWLYVPLPGLHYVRLVGKADIVVPARHLIMDMKVTEDTTWFDKEQLVFYALQWSLLTRKPVTRVATFAPLTKQVFYPYKVEIKDYLNVFGLILEYMQCMRSKSFVPASDDRPCVFCSYRRVYCPRWRVDVRQTLEGKVVEL